MSGKKHTTSLKKKLFKYYFLIAFSAGFLALEVHWDFYKGKLNQQIEKIESEQSQEKALISFKEFTDTLKLKIGVGYALMILVAGVVLLMFFANIITPVQQFIDRTKAIQNGDLSVTLKSESKDELAQLGETINGLTSNMQEIVYIASNTAGKLTPLIDQIDEEIKQNNIHGLDMQIKKAKEQLQELNMIKDYYKFHKVTPNILS